MTNRKSAALSIFHKPSSAACRKYQKNSRPGPDQGQGSCSDMPAGILRKILQD
jgi:hypothetical protein